MNEGVYLIKLNLNEETNNNILDYTTYRIYTILYILISIHHLFVVPLKCLIRPHK